MRAAGGNAVIDIGGCGFLQGEHDDSAFLGVDDPVFGDARGGVLGGFRLEVVGAVRFAHDLDHEVGPFGILLVDAILASADQHDEVRLAIGLQVQPDPIGGDEDLAEAAVHDMGSQNHEQILEDQLMGSGRRR